MAGTIRCPHCGAHGATKFLWIVKCPNTKCRHYNAELAAAIEKKNRVPTGNFNPGANAMRTAWEHEKPSRKRDSARSTAAAGSVGTGGILHQRVDPEGSTSTQRSRHAATSSTSKENIISD